MKKIVLALFLFVSFSFSQSLLGLRYPTGISYPSSSTSTRMGGIGAGMREPYLVSSLNPGNLGSIKQSVYSLSATAGYTRIYEDDKYVDFARFMPAFIGFAFPMGKVGTIGASFKQNGTNTYSYEGTSSLTNTTNNHTILQQNKFENNLSFSAWEFGWGMELFDRISFGFAYQIGQYKNRFCRTDVLQSPNVISGLDSTLYTHASSMLRGGVLGTFGKLSVGISGTYAFYSELNSRTKVMGVAQTLNGISLTQRHDLAEFEKTYFLHIPPHGTLGVGWTFSDKLKTGADFSLVIWDNYSSTAPLLKDANVKNAFSASSGVEFIPQPNLLSPRYFQKVKYSGGLAYRQLPIKGDYETALMLGMGLPLGNSGLLDFSVEAGLRRSDIEDNIKENFVRVNFGMSGGQRWKRTNTNVY